MTGTAVVTPNLGGRRPPEIGGGVGLDGRFVFAHDGSLQAAAGAAGARCAARGFVVERARRLFAPATAGELAAEAEAVLLIRIDRIDFSDPRPDGLRTTIEATVLEALKGAYRTGERLRVRHVQGQDSNGQWNLTAHSMDFPDRRPGDQLLLFVTADAYLGQAEARDGRPLPGHVGAGGGLFRVVGRRIVNDADLTMPETIDQLRDAIDGD